MSEEMQKMMINMKSTFILIYELLVTLWNTLLIIINGIKTYTPIVYNFMYVFTETLYDKGYDDNEPVSPKTPLIDKTWCNIDPDNIIEDEDKKEIVETQEKSKTE
jgi:hypothetical protein